MPQITSSRAVLAVSAVVALSCALIVAGPVAPAHAAVPDLAINDVTMTEGNGGTTSFTFTVSLSAPAAGGGVVFDIAAANGTATAPGDYTAISLTGQTIPDGSSTYSFTVLVTGDLTPEDDETFSANVANVTNATPTDPQGTGTIVNDDLTRVHDVQGNGAATPIPGSVATVEGVVTGTFQAADRLRGFYLQEEDAEVDADPNTSEGIFVFCDACGTLVAEGQRVRVRGTVGEVDGATRLTTANAAAVVVADAGNHLAEVTPSSVDLPVVGDLDSFYETRESMLVTFFDALSVGDLGDLARRGQVTLLEGGVPREFTDANPPSTAGYAAYLDGLARRRVVLDDGDNATFAPLGKPNGLQAILHPSANGGFSVGTQSIDFVRLGDLVNGLTGILDGSTTPADPATWRVRPVAAHPATFTLANPRPATTPAISGTIRAASVDLDGYFTTIDTTASTTTGPCGPSGTAECAGADSVAELNRQRERASIALCAINADVTALTGLENTTPSASVNDLLGAVNARCGGAHPYAFVNTGGTLGVDVTRVAQVYRTGNVAPVGSALVDLDPSHDRPPTAQTFDVVDPANPAFGERLTVMAVDFTSSACTGAETGSDVDTGDGQGCFTARRVAQANRLLTWLTGTVLPAAGDPDVLVLGRLQAHGQSSPMTALTGAGLSDALPLFSGAGGYSVAAGGARGNVDHALTTSSLTPQLTGAAAWHIDADESAVFDYSDEVADVGEQAGEEKPDGSALVPPRVVFQPATSYRLSSTDPLVVGLFEVADLGVTLTDAPDPVTVGADLTYTITVTNNGPDPAATASWSGALPAGTTFVSLSGGTGWSCTTPAVGTGGTVTCSTPSFAVGSAVFTLIAHVGAAPAGGAMLTDTVSVSSPTIDPNGGNNSATATTTVNKAGTATAITSHSPDPSAVGEAVTVQYQVSVPGGSGGTPTGSVTVTDGTTSCSGTVAAGQCVITFPSSGVKTLTATYAGDDAYVGSTSAGATHTVVLQSNAPTVAQVSARCPSPSTGILVWRVADAQGDSVTVRLVGTSNPALVAARDVSVTSDGPTGSLRFVSVTARAGSGTARLTFSVSDGASTIAQVVRVRVGGEGPDTFRARPGSNLLLGRGGADHLVGGTGTDIICGGAARDVLVGGDGNDFLFGKDGGDVLTGSSGADLFSGGRGADRLTDFSPAQGDTRRRHRPGP